MNNEMPQPFRHSGAAIDEVSRLGRELLALKKEREGMISFSLVQAAFDLIKKDLREALEVVQRSTSAFHAKIEDQQKQIQELHRRIEYMDADRVSLIQSHETDLEVRDHQIKELTRWKAEALPILSGYDDIGETCPGDLGSSKLENLKVEIARLREVEKTYLAIPVAARILYA